MRADLAGMGRSLSELGRTLRWSDLRAVLKHLPEGSYFRQVLAAWVSGDQPDKVEVSRSSVGDRDAVARDAAARIRAGL